MADTYAEAAERARQGLAAARLADPDEHFPFKTAEAKAALKAKNLGPTAETKSQVAGVDFTSARIIEATDAYIAAQAAVLADPSRANREGFDAATDDLVAARKTHRRARVDENGNPVANIVGVTDAVVSPGIRARRVGEE